MSQRPERSKHEAAKKKPESQLPNNNTLMVIRLVVASVIFAVSLIVSMPDFLSIILLVIAAAAAGYDIVLKAMTSIEEGDYFSVPVVVVFIALLSYFIGFAIEGAALILLYQIGLMLINYAVDHTKKAALELLNYQDDGIKSKMAELINDREATAMSVESVMKSSSGSVLKLAMILSVIYAVALPIFTNYTYIVSIHRALTIILIAALIVAMSFTGSAAGSNVCFIAINETLLDLSVTPYFYGSAFVPYTVFGNLKIYSAYFPDSKAVTERELGLYMLGVKKQTAEERGALYEAAQ